MKKIHLIISPIVCIGLAVVLSVPVQAYKQKYPMEKKIGYSVESAKFKQIINHEPVDNEAVEGLDGQTAVKVMEQYRNSFGKKQDTSGSPSQGMSLGLSEGVKY